MADTKEKKKKSRKVVVATHADGSVIHRTRIDARTNKNGVEVPAHYRYSGAKVNYAVHKRTTDADGVRHIGIGVLPYYNPRSAYRSDLKAHYFITHPESERIIKDVSPSGFKRAAAKLDTYLINHGYAIPGGAGKRPQMYNGAKRPVKQRVTKS